MRRVLVRGSRITTGGLLAVATLLTATVATHATAAQVRTVGPGTECNFSDLQDAFDAVKVLDATVELQLTRDFNHFAGGTYEIDMGQWDLAMDLTVRGGYESCGDDDPPFGSTALDANGNGRVFTIQYDVDDSAAARVITLENLSITGGETAHSGGGILIEGHSGRQRVRLRSVGFSENHADADGGAIALEDTAGSDSDTDNVWFVLDDPSTVSFNTALTGSGGGISCTVPFGKHESGVIVLVGPVFGNEAHSGGGLNARGCTLRAYGTITNNNSIGVGGGVQVIGGTITMSSASESIEGITLGESSSAIIAGNQSEFHAGGAFVGGAEGHLELIDVQVVDNHAESSGGGFYISVGAELHMYSTAGANCPGAGCSRLSQNTANVNGDNGNYGGAALALHSGSAVIERTFIQDNASGGTASVVTLDHREGDPPIIEPGPEANLKLESVLMTGNQGAGALIAGIENFNLEINFSTFTGNPQADSELTLIDVSDPENQSVIKLQNSIFWEPESDGIIESSGSIDSLAKCIIGHVDASESGIAQTEFYSQIDPEFINPAASNFQLKHDSPAIDYCDGSQLDEPAPDTDLFNQPRGLVYDLPTIEAPNAQGGAHDLGAFERQLDTLFYDRFH